MSSPMNESFDTDDIIEAEHIKQVFGPLGDLEEGQAFFRVDSGAVNAYKVDFSGTGDNKNEIAAYKQGQLILFKAANTNTGASTLQVTGPAGDLSAVPITKSGSAALVAGDIQEDQIVAVVYNSEGRFEMVGAPSEGSLAGLGDVNLSSLSAGQILKYDGSDWSNANFGASEMPSGIDAAKIGSGDVSNAEFGYLDGVTGSIQSQLDGKASSSHTHAAADVTSGQVALARGGTGADLSATGGSGQVLKQTSSGGAVSVGNLTASEMPSGIDAAKIGSGDVSNAEFGYLDGVTGPIQSQLDGKASSSHSHAAADIVSGVIDPARLGSGSPSGSNFLRGDGTWASAGSTIPVGTVLPFSGASAPSGWLLCAGQNVSRSTYSELHSLLQSASYPYGSGDGSTTFTLPDLRGRVVAGKDDMGGTAASRITNSGTGNPGINGTTLGAGGGVDRHQLTTAEMPSHSHTYQRYSTTFNCNSGGASVWYSVSTQNTSNTGSNASHRNVQPTLILNYIIFAGV